MILIPIVYIGFINQLITRGPKKTSWSPAPAPIRPKSQRLGVQDPQWTFGGPRQRPAINGHWQRRNQPLPGLVNIQKTIENCHRNSEHFPIEHGDFPYFFFKRLPEGISIATLIIKHGEQGNSH